MIDTPPKSALSMTAAEYAIALRNLARTRIADIPIPSADSAASPPLCIATDTTSSVKRAPAPAPLNSHGSAMQMSDAEWRAALSRLR